MLSYNIILVNILIINGWLVYFFVKLVFLKNEDKVYLNG